MKKINIAIKNKTKLTKYLEENYDVTYYAKPSLLSKIFSKNNQDPDIYFHQGSINSKSLPMMEKSKRVIVSTNGMKNEITDKFPQIDGKKIDILYPYVTNNIEYDEDIKKSFREKYKIDDDTKIIYFTAKDLSASGVKKFLKIISEIEEKNFKVLIDADKKQLDQLKMLINRLKIDYQIILLEDHKNKDELFIASDIFILPTKQKVYSPNILKAMYFKNAVFVPTSNYGSEIIDTFSIMNSPDDPSTAFKVGALLANNEELVQIQNLNNNMSNSFSFASRLDIVKSIIESVSEKD
ncbi:MAG: glycosyltransferase [Campylobacterota bacterium]|nr:glycosyltransferase [Campylobacterota bacterium]